MGGAGSGRKPDLFKRQFEPKVPIASEMFLPNISNVERFTRERLPNIHATYISGSHISCDNTISGSLAGRDGSIVAGDLTVQNLLGEENLELYADARGEQGEWSPYIILGSDGSMEISSTAGANNKLVIDTPTVEVKNSVLTLNNTSVSGTTADFSGTVSGAAGVFTGDVTIWGAGRTGQAALVVDDASNHWGRTKLYSQSGENFEMRMANTYGLFTSTQGFRFGTDDSTDDLILFGWGTAQNLIVRRDHSTLLNKPDKFRVEFGSGDTWTAGSMTVSGSMTASGVHSSAGATASGAFSNFTISGGIVLAAW